MDPSSASNPYDQRRNQLTSSSAGPPSPPNRPTEPIKKNQAEYFEDSKTTGRNSILYFNNKHSHGRKSVSFHLF